LHFVWFLKIEGGSSLKIIKTLVTCFALIVTCFALITGAFILGMKWQEYQYSDICLDMGGGKNPGESPICILEKTITKPEEIFKPDEYSRKLIGPWLIEGEDWGFTLYNDGTASSINAATLIYQQWRIKNGQLCLTARSIGNHTQSVSEECLNYKITGKDGKAKLSIGEGNYKTTYNRP
jgi:hypothetical protein